MPVSPKVNGTPDVDDPLQASSLSNSGVSIDGILIAGKENMAEPENSDRIVESQNASQTSSESLPSQKSKKQNGLDRSGNSTSKVSPDASL